jgi:hypothetical protein
MRDDATSASTTHPEATRDDATRDFADTERRGVGAAHPSTPHREATSDDATPGFTPSKRRGDGRRFRLHLARTAATMRRHRATSANHEATSDERRAQQADDADRDNLHQGSSTRQGRQHIGRPLGAERRDD